METMEGTSPPEMRTLIYQRSGVWHEKVQEIDAHYSKPLKRPEGPNVLVEFVSPPFKQHYQVELARTDIRTLRQEHKDLQIELRKSRAEQRQAELRIDQLNAQVRTSDEKASDWQQKEANLSQEILDLRSKLAKLNRQYHAMESLHRSSRERSTTQHDQIHLPRERLSFGSSMASEAIAQENQVLKLKLGSVEDQNLTRFRRQKEEHEQELLKLHSIGSTRKDEIQALREKLAGVSNSTTISDSLQAKVRDLAQNEIASAKKQIDQDLLKEVRGLLDRMEPVCSKDITSRNELLILKMTLKELERENATDIAVSKASNEQILPQVPFCQKQHSEIASARLSALESCSNASGLKQGEYKSSGGKLDTLSNFFDSFSDHIDTMVQKMSMSDCFEDNKKRQVFIRAKTAAQKYLNHLGNTSPHFRELNAGTSSAIPRSGPEFPGGLNPVLAVSHKHPLETPLLPSAKRVKFSQDKTSPGSWNSSVANESIASQQNLPAPEVSSKLRRCDDCKRKHKRCIHGENGIHGDNGTVNVTKTSPQPSLKAFSTEVAAEESLIPYNLSTISVHKPLIAPGIHGAPKETFKENLNREKLLQTAKVHPVTEDFSQKINDVIDAFRNAGYTSCYESSLNPQRSLYAYRRICRIFKAQPWEITNAPPLFWGRDLLQSLGTLAELMARASDPLQRTKTMLERQIKSREATGSDAVLKLSDVKKVIEELREASNTTTTDLSLPKDNRQSGE